MKTKKDIVKDWITRYTGVELDSFGDFILLTNFQKYVDEFAKLNKVMKYASEPKGIIVATIKATVHNEKYINYDIILLKNFP